MSTAKAWSPGTVPRDAVTLVTRVEDFRAAPYDDGGGVWTIGFGSTRDGDDRPVTPNTPPVTIDQAEVLLMRDMVSAAKSVQSQVQRVLLEHQAAALISWTYNLGAGNLASSTMLRKITQGEFSAVPSEMRRWHLQGKTPLLGLVRRRWAEAALWLGADPDRAAARAWTDIRQLTDWPDFAPSLPHTAKPPRLRSVPEGTRSSPDTTGGAEGL